MELSFNSEQIQLQESAKRFAETHKGDASNPDKLWQAMVEAGWHLVISSENNGGLGYGAVEAVALQLGLGQTAFLTPLTTCLMSSALLQACNTAAACERLQQANNQGELIATALFEPDYRYAINSQIKARSIAGQLHLKGQKVAVPYGQIAQGFLVNITLKDQQALVYIPANTSGLTLHHFTNIDKTPISVLNIDVVIDQQAHLLSGDAQAAIEYALALANTLQGAEAVALSDALVAQTIDYCKQRQQFGQPIASYQAIQHRLVDMYIASQTLRSNLYATTAKLAEGADDGIRAAAKLKIQVGVKARWIAEMAVQSHGAIGYTEELALNNFYKRIMVIDKSYGDVCAHTTQLLSA